MSSLAEPLVAPADPAVEAPISFPTPLAFVRGLAGYALLGVVAALGGPEVVHHGGAGLISGAGALVLTVPALLVVHPFVGLRAPPEALVAAILRPFARVGDVCLGLTPALLLFRATSGLAPALLALALFGSAILGFSLSIRELVRAEPGAVGRMTLLAWAWSGLAALIGARLAIGLL